MNWSGLRIDPRRFGWLLATIGLGLGACSDEASQNLDEPALGHVAAPLWVNGNFENGTHGAPPPDWEVKAYYNPSIANLNPQNFSQLGLQASSEPSYFRTYLRTAAGGEGSVTDSDAPNIKWPRFGNGVAVLDVSWGAVANSMEQTMTLTVDDIDPADGKLHIRFAVAPILQDPGHGPIEQPYWYVELVNVTKNVTLYRDFNYANQPGVPWQSYDPSGSGWEANVYTDWQLVDIAPNSVQATLGDQIKLLVVASGCSPTGHWARVYVDGVGPTVPSLFVSATGPASANAGNDITYDLYYNNGGTGAAGDSVVKVVIPANTTFQGISGIDPANCTIPPVGSGGTVICNVGTVNPGQSGSFQVTVRIDSAATGTITLGNYSIESVTVPPLLGPKVFTNITTNANYADLHVTKTDGVGGVAWGSSTTYTIVVRNDGPNAATGATVVDTLPAQLTNGSWTCVGAGGGTCGATSGTGNINTTVDLPVNATATFTLDTNIIAGSGNGQITNTVTITPPAGVTDSYPNNNGAVDTNFIGELVTVDVSKIGIGQGNLVSVPSAINCGPTCTSASATFVSGQQIVLSVNPLPGHTFLGWGGDCAFAGTANCTITLTDDIEVTANITRPTDPNGTGCTRNEECTSGICVDGVCCNDACGGGAADCQACNLPGSLGTCSYLNLPDVLDDECDNIDADCDGQTDEDFVEAATTCGTGECANTGHLTCTNGQLGNTCVEGTPTDEVCDTKDNDCDGFTDAADPSLVLIPCANQQGVCAGSTRTAAQCVDGAWLACPDSVYASHAFPNYGLTDACDGLDNDCDGTTDENHVVQNTSCGAGVCASTGQRICSNGGVVDTCTAGTPAASDATCDFLDDDCDGQTDEDYVPPQTQCGIGACARTGLAHCVRGVVFDTCNAGDPQSSDINCNNVDDDCDGGTDEDFPPNQLCVVGRGACERAGAFVCSAGGVVCSATPGQPTAEVCDGIDNDCDGQTDEGVIGTLCQVKDTEILTAPPVVTAAHTATFTFHDPLAPSSTAFECSLDGAAWIRCDGGAISFSGLTDGAHTFLVRSIGPDGTADPTPAFYAWQVDSSQPDTFFITAPANPSQSTTASFIFGATVTEISGYRCALDPANTPPTAADFAPCDPAEQYEDLDEGPHSLWVYVISASGVADPTPAVHHWVIDLSAPETEITDGPETITNDTDATFTYRSPGNPAITTYLCRLDGGPWVDCNGGQATFEDLDDGEHTFEVVAIDETGTADPTPATWHWEVDTTPPDTFITVRPDNPSQTSNATFHFASDERDVTYRCALDIDAPPSGDAAWQSCDQVLTLNELALGSHTIHVVAVDTAGQWDPTPATWTWIVDPSAPETVIDSGPPVQTGPNDGAGVEREDHAAEAAQVDGRAGGGRGLHRRGQRRHHAQIAVKVFHVRLLTPPRP